MAAALLDSHKALTYRATHDDLTGLANRAALAERLLASFEPDSDRRTRVLLAERLRASVRSHDLVARLGGDRSLRVSLSMGVAQRTADTADLTELLRQADSAMYRAKHGGKAREETHGG